MFSIDAILTFEITCIDNNMVKSIPSEIGFMEKLETIWLSELKKQSLGVGCFWWLLFFVETNILSQIITKFHMYQMRLDF